MSLATHIADHVSMGSEDRSRSLGIRKMPEGYALMLNPDQSHFYWLRSDGAQSEVSWSMWAVRRGAMKNSGGREKAA
jgi:hypothetical protein